MTYEFSHWGERIWTSELPASYIPGQLLARLPGAFLLLLAVACIYALAARVALLGTGWCAAMLTVARRRAILIVGAAVILPVGFLIIQRATLYDGIRHVLFVIPHAGNPGWPRLPGGCCCRSCGGLP